MDESAYIKKYLENAKGAIDVVDPQKIVQAIHLLKDARDRGASVFLAGNGGSSAVCSHFACDLNKPYHTPPANRMRFRAVCLNDNVPLLTAWANDTDMSVVFSEPLKNLAKPGDVVVLVSSSGKSPNIVKAAQTAKELGCKVLGFSGFTGGPLKELSDVSLHVDNSEYGHVEATHDILCHLVSLAIRDSDSVTG
jgi:D-sedoheptulose 7-phosphate isomerase